MGEYFDSIVCLLCPCITSKDGGRKLQAELDQTKKILQETEDDLEDAEDEIDDLEEKIEDLEEQV